MWPHGQQNKNANGLFVYLRGTFELPKNSTDIDTRIALLVSDQVHKFLLNCGTLLVYKS